MAPTTLTDLSAPTRTTTLDIGVDLDGVCYSFDEALARWIAANTDHPADKLVPVDRWNTWECWDTDIDTWLGWFAAAVDDGYVFNDGDPYPGVVDGLTRLAAAGHRLHVITDRGRTGTAEIAQASTRTWIDRHQLPIATLTFSKDKTTRRTDVFIEDRAENYLDLVDAGVDCYLVDRPWNSHLEVPADRRIAGVSAFADAILAS